MDAGAREKRTLGDPVAQPSAFQLKQFHSCLSNCLSNFKLVFQDKKRVPISLQGVYYNLELFRMAEKNIPIDTLEIKGGLFINFSDIISKFEKKFS